MGEHSEACVGIDVAKGRDAIAVARCGTSARSPAGMTLIVRRLVEKYNRVQFCYVAGLTGYGLYGPITAAPILPA